MRQVLLGADPSVELSRRARAQLAITRGDRAALVEPGFMVLQRDGDSSTLWTLAGDKANRSIAPALTAAGLEANSDAFAVRAVGYITVRDLAHAGNVLASATPPAPALRQEVLEGLKFGIALPPGLASDTLVERLTDVGAAVTVCRASVMAAIA